MSSSTGFPRPTAWLAPPEGLLPSSHPIRIEPVPIAIGATLAIIVGGALIILFYLMKDVFLEDTVLNIQEEEEPYAVKHDNTKIAVPATAAGIQVHSSPPFRISKSMISEPTLIPKTQSDPPVRVNKSMISEPVPIPKKQNNDSARPSNAVWGSRQSNSAQDTIVKRNQCQPPCVRRRESDFDGNTLDNGKRNSARYLPARCEVSLGTKTLAMSALGEAHLSHRYSPDDGASEVQSIFIEKHIPGDAY